MLISQGLRYRINIQHTKTFIKIEKGRWTFSGKRYFRLLLPNFHLPCTHFLPAISAFTPPDDIFPLLPSPDDRQVTTSASRAFWAFSHGLLPCPQTTVCPQGQGLSSRSIPRRYASSPTLSNPGSVRFPCNSVRV